MARIAIRMLLAQRQRFAAAILGIAFSVVLVNVQGGLFLGMIHKASMLVDHSEADIWIGHRKIHNVDFARDIPQRWKHRIQGLPGVAIAAPYLLGYQMMSMPSGAFEMVVVVGVDVESMLGHAWSVPVGDRRHIRQPGTIVADLHDQDKIGQLQLGEHREVGGRRLRIAALSQGILGFVVTPYVFTSFHVAADILNKPANVCSYVLVKAADGANKVELQDAIRQKLPDAAVYTNEQFAKLSRRFWLRRTGIGVSFGAATVLGFLVGMAVVGQTLYASVVDRLAEFATLIVMGADSKQLLMILWSQSSFLSAIGIFLGLLASWAFQEFCHLPRASVEIPWQLSFLSSLLVAASCLVCALFPYWRICKVEPASVI